MVTSYFLHSSYDYYWFLSNESMDNHFILQLNIHYCQFFFLVAVMIEIVPDLGIRSSFKWTSVSLLTSPITFRGFLKTIFGTRDIARASRTFPAWVLEQAVSARRPGSFYWKTDPETRIWGLHAIEASLFLSQQRYFLVPVWIHVHAHTRHLYAHAPAWLYTVDVDSGPIAKAHRSLSPCL